MEDFSLSVLIKHVLIKKMYKKDMENERETDSLKRRQYPIPPLTHVLLLKSHSCLCLFSLITFFIFIALSRGNTLLSKNQSGKREEKKKDKYTKKRLHCKKKKGKNKGKEKRNHRESGTKKRK